MTAVRYRVEHRTAYNYDRKVSTSYGRMYLLPRDCPGQRTVSSDLAVTPVADELRTHTDHFGNRSSFFLVSAEHDWLVVGVRSVVDVDRTVDVLPPGLRWEEARDAVAVRPPTGADPAEVLDARQFTLFSPLVVPDRGLRDLAAPSFPADRPLSDCLTDLLGRIRADFAYEPGATTIGTALGTVLVDRRGVCQDFAHVFIGCLRSVGLAARYVSGYLATDPPLGRPRLRGADATHAWASVFVPGGGWVDLDPTNGVFVRDRHIVTAWGRDYADVPPLKGVIFTEGNSSEMKVSVDVTTV